MTQLSDIPRGKSLWEIVVGESTFQSNWDVILFMAPFVAMMAMSMFRLDEYLFTPKAPRPSRHRTFCGPDRYGREVLSDPDGRPLPPRRARR
jgi:hypothetical protein